MPGSGTLQDPFTTLDDVPTLNDGEVVAIEDGSSLKDKISWSAPNVKLVRYGSGDPPVIDGSEEVTGWTQNGTYSNVWETQVTPNQDFTAGGELMLWKNDTRLRRASDVQDVSNNGGWYADDFSPAGPSETTIYVQSGNNPDSSGDMFECSLNDHGIDILEDADGFLVEGPATMQRHFGHYGSVSVTKAEFGDLKKLLLIDGNVHHTVTSGRLTEDVIALGGDPDNPGISLTAYTPDPTGKNHTFRRCIVIGSGTLRSAGQEGYYAHGSGSFWNDASLIDCVAKDVEISRLDATGVKTYKGGYWVNTDLRDVNEGDPIELMALNGSNLSGLRTGDRIRNVAMTDGNMKVDPGGSGGWSLKHSVVYYASKTALLQFPGETTGVVVGQRSGQAHKLDTSEYIPERILFLGANVRADIDGSFTNGFDSYKTATGDTTSVLERDVTSDLDEPPSGMLGDPSDGDFRIDPDIPIFQEEQAEFGNLGQQRHRRLDGTEVDGPQCHWPTVPETRSEAEEHLQQVDQNGTYSDYTRPPLEAPATDVQVRPGDAENLVTWRPPDTQTYTEQIVERSADGGSTWTQVAFFAGPKTRYYYRDTGVSNGKKYSYRIKVNDN
jgi:hypothetical protein